MIENYFKYIILIVPFFFVYIPSQFFPFRPHHLTCHCMANFTFISGYFLG